MKTRSQTSAGKTATTQAPNLFKREAGIIKSKCGLCDLNILPRELRNKIYELAQSEYASRVLADGDIQPPATIDSGPLRTSTVLRMELVNSSTGNRTLTVCIEEDYITTNSRMHDLTTWKQQTPRSATPSLSQLAGV